MHRKMPEIFFFSFVYLFIATDANTDASHSKLN